MTACDRNGGSQLLPPEHAFSFALLADLHISGAADTALPDEASRRLRAAVARINAGAADDAELHDAPGGTLPWLADRLSGLASTAQGIVLLQHHPVAAPWYDPAPLLTFDDAERDRLRQVLAASSAAPRIWGLCAGHLHRAWQGAAFADWPAPIQLQTAASADGDHATLVRVAADGVIEAVTDW